MDVVTPRRFEVWLLNQDPTLGSEINKTRPCLVISPDEMNLSHINAVIVAPMTTTQKPYPTRINLNFNNQEGQVALDQIRTVDKIRFKKQIGRIKPKEQKAVTRCLSELFSE